MYANIRVSTEKKTHYAHRIEIVAPDVVRVFLDANDGESDYAEPDGFFDHHPSTDGPLVIEADF